MNRNGLLTDDEAARAGPLGGHSYREKGSSDLRFKVKPFSVQQCRLALQISRAICCVDRSTENFRSLRAGQRNILAYRSRREFRRL